MDQVIQTNPSDCSNALLLHNSALGVACVGEQTASAASLLGLPVELQKTILEYVRFSASWPFGVTVLTRKQLTTNADKKNVCLTCKEMQVLVTPLLYKNIEIDVERLREDLFPTLKEGHPGLAQARTLRIVTEDPAEYAVLAGMTLQQAENVCRLLHAIPRHALTRFEYEQMHR